MSQEFTDGDPLPRGVTALPRSRNGRRFLAKIRQRGVEVHLGLYESAGHAGFAFNIASEAIGRGSRPPNEIPGSDQPDADLVREITGKVRSRLGLAPSGRRLVDLPPDPDTLLTFFEITVVGFWRSQAAQSDPDQGLDAAGRRLAEAARLVFWSPETGQPRPAEVLTKLLGRRVDLAFRRADLTRAILDDDGDDDWRVARWLVYPDVYARTRGFVDEVRWLYPEHFEGEPDSPSSTGGVPHWAHVLRVDPPFHLEKIREAYRSRSKLTHPDAGGSHHDFIKLQAAYDEAREYCRIMGV